MKLFENLSNTQTEEEVKNIFAKFFNLKLDTKNYIDLYTPQILFEFKFDANIKNLPTLAACFAQTLYYIRRLKYGDENRKPSNFICVVTKNFAALAPTENFSNFYLKSKAKNFDWDLAPSSPCKKLVAALANSEILKNLHVYDFSIEEDEKNFIAEIQKNLVTQGILFENRKEINEDNFYEIFKFWEKLFGKYVENGRKSSEYFITDIEIGKTDIVTGRKSLIFRMSDGAIIEKFLPLKDYQHFWEIYEKIYQAREVISIRQKMDRMTEIDLRRRTGEFFTPINFAKKAVEYLARTVGENWFKSGKFRLWDMCAGTGNLEFALPAEAWKFCYISTLLDDDAKYCKKIYPAATVFQYDYLNDDVDLFFSHQQNFFQSLKMPKNLLNDLQNPELKWIIFINPPYATASNFERTENRKDKNNVSMTKIRDLMNAENLGATSRELYVQFLYRISREFENKNARLGIFSTTKYINANNDQKLRDEIFQYKFERGFVFSSKNFQGCKGQFPVGFLVWNLSEKISLDKQKISLDVFNSDVEKIAVKNMYSINKKFFLNKWVNRPKNTKKFPPMSSGLKFAFNKKIPCDKIPENFLASLLCWNDFLHQNYTAILSGPYGTAGGMSITPENFEQYLVIHAVHLIPKIDWLNNRDQFMQPTGKLTREFINDCVVWSLFAPSNQTVSLRNVEYEGEIYRMKNNLFPITLAELKSWRVENPDFRLQIEREVEERFAAAWIRKNFAEISAEGKNLLAAGREVYKIFYEKFFELEFAKYKIFDWDAGWYQVRMSLKDAGLIPENFSAEFKQLGEKILPQIYKLGFLRDEVKYF